ncbi:SEFIR domain-containing protein [Pediococcus siamensis]|uniref:SEFIR domain-containing protein n=1 Tax=Pediococcus siamensis TaxID=381829 RepID=UPI00399F0BB0
MLLRAKLRSSCDFNVIRISGKCLSRCNGDRKKDSHQNVEYNNRVLDFTNRLRGDGIDANVDQFVDSPGEGWQRWMNNQIRTADFVIVMSSKAYLDRSNGDAAGDGTVWESGLIMTELSETALHNQKYMAAFFDVGKKEFILSSLKLYMYYNVSDDDEYKKLVNRLLGIPNNIKAKLGKPAPLEEKEAKTLFVSSPIDIPTWNRAHWRGALYIFQKGYVPILALVFNDFVAGKKIFVDWKNILQDQSAENIMSISFIAPPFPSDNWIYKSKKQNLGAGYFIFIGPNIAESKKRAEKLGLKHEDSRFATFSRYRWMDETQNSKNRSIFKKWSRAVVAFILLQPNSPE